MKHIPIGAISAVALCAMLAGCNAQSIANIAANVAAAAPTTCSDLQQITGDLTAFAGQVSAANSSNAKVQTIVKKLNSGTPLVNADCQAIAALAPSVAAGATLGVTIGSQVK